MPSRITSWTGQSDGISWFTPGNWSAGAPSAGETVRFADGGTWNIILEPQPGAPSASAGSVTVTGDTLTLTYGTLALAAPAAPRGLTTDLTIASGQVTVAATATLTAASAISSFGALVIRGAVTAPVLTALGGDVTLDRASARLTTSAVAVIGHALTVSSGARMTDGGAGGQLTLGSGASSGPATATVDGAHSHIGFGQIYLGNGYSGVLTVQNGGAVTAGLINLGQGGDGTLTLTGKTSKVITNTLVVGGEVPVASTVTVTDGGRLAVGDGGLLLRDGTLTLDPTARVTLAGGTDSEAGRIHAAGADTGAIRTTHLAGSLYCGVNPFDGSSVTYLSATGRTFLSIDGAISGDTRGTLQASGGRVVLTHVANTLSHVSLYAGTLELAATGAAGTGDISFVGPSGPGTPAIRLLVDASAGTPTNTILGFGAGDVIDLHGFAFAPGITSSFADGTLTLTAGSATTSLTLAGSYVSGDFLLTKDAAGGTAIFCKHH